MIQQTVKQILSITDDKKGADIKAYHVAPLTVLADYFIIATANSAAQTGAIADEIEKQLRVGGHEPKNISGLSGGGWVLMDYGDIIVHLFSSEMREFYALDKLWADASQLTVNIEQ